MKDVILTGLRANSELTLGNYLGGILPMIEMQQKFAKTHQINMFVPDLHSFTTPIDHSQLQASIFNNLKVYAAAGLDLDNPNTFIYRQSYIPAHSELTWILDCFTGMGELSRMTQFKDKSASLSKESISVGLFNYPVLMTTDILLYNAKYVPVGEDQFQHLEITRDIAERMNKKFGQIFVVPENTAKQTAFINRDQGLRIRSLTNPEKKMSKSDENPKSKILLTDDPQQAHKKIMSATTDNIGQINYDWQNQPGITNLLTILAYLTNQDLEQVKTKYCGQTQYGEFKKDVATAVQTFLEDFQTKLAKVDEQKLLAKLEQSEIEMNKIANQTLLRAQKAVGLR